MEPGRGEGGGVGGALEGRAPGREGPGGEMVSCRKKRRREEEVELGEEQTGGQTERRKTCLTGTM